MSSRWLERFCQTLCSADRLNRAHASRLKRRKGRRYKSKWKRYRKSKSDLTAPKRAPRDGLGCGRGDVERLHRGSSDAYSGARNDSSDPEPEECAGDCQQQRLSEEEGSHHHATAA